MNFEQYFNERNAMRDRKLRGEKPLSSDPILATRHFCNNDRTQDRFSIWLMENWYNTTTKKSIVADTVTARFFNREPVLLRLNQLRTPPPHWFHRVDEVVEIIDEMVAAKEKIFNFGAYTRFLTKDTGARFGRLLAATENVRLQETARETAATLKVLPEVGDFLSSQIVLDMIMIGVPFSDRRTYVPIGPGSIRGANRILKAPIDRPMSEKTFINLATNLATLLDTTPAIIEHALCEYDKYLRFTERNGKGARYYRPGGPK